MARRIELSVTTLDRAPMWGTSRDLVPLHECDGKSMAAKLTEEAAEAFKEWQNMQAAVMRGYGIGLMKDHLADELADLIVLACDLAKVYDIDLQDALDRCERRNRERGRIGS